MIPNKIRADWYTNQVLSTSGDRMLHNETWVPARHHNVGWNAFDAIATRFRLAWLVFTGRADALTYDE